MSLVLHVHLSKNDQVSVKVIEQTSLEHDQCEGCRKSALTDEYIE